VTWGLMGEISGALNVSMAELEGNGAVRLGVCERRRCVRAVRACVRSYIHCLCVPCVRACRASAYLSMCALDGSGVGGRPST
jgi:hypothetical protein